MYMQSYMRYGTIAKIQMKLLRNNAIFALLLTCLILTMFNIRYLNSFESSVILERYLSLDGVILLSPLFSSEQDCNVRETVESKYTSSICVILIRLALSIASLMLLLSTTAWIMYYNGSLINGALIFGSIISSLFLGSLGFMTYAISDNLIVSYLIPLCYFMLNFFAGRNLNNFYLFSLGDGYFIPKYWLMIGSIFFIVVGILFRAIRNRVR